jgi:transcriptional regulator GlxA family with amidase domain
MAPPATTPSPLRVGVVALPDATASTVYGVHDFFASVGRDWEVLVEGRNPDPGAPAVECAIVGPSARGFRAANGSWIRPTAAFGDALDPSPDVVCVPDLAIVPGAPIGPGGREACAWVRACHAAGATVASACSGAMLLAEAGLLDGADVTTHWAFCDALAKSHPAVRVHPERCLVESGEGHRIVTAGGGFAWHDLALYLVARFFGEEEAMRQARLHLIDWHAHGQLPFTVLARARQRDDAIVAEAQTWAAEHYREARPVAAMTARSGLAERTFKRRFRRATGMTPIEYVQTLRLEEAKRRLETSDEPVEGIAIEVGYEDASFFRRLFRRKVGLTALEYRRRFGGVRRTLRAAAASRGR